MDERKSNNNRQSVTRKRYIILGLTLVAILIIIVGLFQFLKPERSVALYCKVYKEQAAQLSKSQGDTYEVGVFKHKSSNPSDFVKAFSKLNEVAPNDIQPDVNTLKQIFQKVEKDPSQYLSAGMSGLGAESNVKEWTINHCGSVQ
jgi:hypothetical protein